MFKKNHHVFPFMIVIIDNQDSFTYNLAILLAKQQVKYAVISNTKNLYQLQKLKPTKLILSPGPSTPSTSKLSLASFLHYHTLIPVLGVCLGHQLICQHFGAQLVKCPSIIHGQTAALMHTNNSILQNVTQNSEVVRYNSLTCTNIKEPLKVIGYDAKTKEVMAVKHLFLPIFGVQFHPDSFLTKEGFKIINNFLHIYNENN